MRYLIALLLLLASFAPAWAIDVNGASAEELARELINVGAKKAADIVEHRQRHGPFKSFDDLRAVKGIGDRTLELNRDRIRFEPDAGLPAAPGAKPDKKHGAMRGAESGAMPGAMPGAMHDSMSAPQAESRSQQR